MVQQGALGGINQRNKEARNQAAPPSPIPSGGLNQLMNQKVDAYSSNPQALEKRYQQNQQLIDLLALQKIKTDKTAAANNIALQMQQNPSTIAQQREQEVLAMTKNEMAQQTAGILGQRQKQQQKNMQRTARGQNVAPQDGAMMAARGGLMPLPRPNMQKMASGGILGYQTGAEVISDEDLKKLGMTREEYMAKVMQSRGLTTPIKPPTPEEQKEQEAARIAKLKQDNRLLAEELGVLPKVKPKTSPFSEDTGIITKNIVDNAAKGVSTVLEDKKKRDAESLAAYNKKQIEKLGGVSPEAATATTVPKDVARSVTPVNSNKGMSGLPSVGAFTKKLQKMQGPDPEQKPGAGVLAPGQVAVAGQGVLKSPSPTPTGPTPTGIATELPVVKPVDTSTLQQNRVSSRLDPAVTNVFQENMSADPTALGIKARTDQDEFARRKEFFDKRQENIAGIAALNKQDFDPDKLAKQRRLAALAPYNASVRGMLQADNAVESARYNRELVNVRLDDASMKEDSATAAKSGEIGQKMYDSITKSRSDAAKAYASLSAADQVAVDAEAKRILEADKGNLSAILKQLEIESTNALRMAIQSSQTLGQLQQRYREVIEIKDKAVQAVNNNLDAETIEAIKAVKRGTADKEQQRLQSVYTSMITDIMSGKYASYEQYILAEIARVSGVPFPKVDNSGAGGAGGVSGNFIPNP